MSPCHSENYRPRIMLSQDCGLNVRLHRDSSFRANIAHEWPRHVCLRGRRARAYERSAYGYDLFRNYQCVRSPFVNAVASSGSPQSSAQYLPHHFLPFFPDGAKSNTCAPTRRSRLYTVPREHRQRFASSPIEKNSCWRGNASPVTRPSDCGIVVISLWVGLTSQNQSMQQPDFWNAESSSLRHRSTISRPPA